MYHQNGQRDAAKNAEVAALGGLNDSNMGEIFTMILRFIMVVSGDMLPGTFLANLFIK